MLAYANAAARQSRAGPATARSERAEQFSAVRW